MLRRDGDTFRPKAGNAALLGDSLSRQPYSMDSTSIIWRHLLQNPGGAPKVNKISSFIARNRGSDRK